MENRTVLYISLSISNRFAWHFQ